MSSIFLNQRKSPPSPNSATIQKLLDENTQLIMCIAENQNKGNAAECISYQQVLHKNLVYLATMADYNQQNPTPGQPNTNEPINYEGASQNHQNKIPPNSFQSQNEQITYSNKQNYNPLIDTSYQRPFMTPNSQYSSLQNPDITTNKLQPSHHAATSPFNQANSNQHQTYNNSPHNLNNNNVYPQGIPDNNPSHTPINYPSNTNRHNFGNSYTNRPAQHHMSVYPPYFQQPTTTNHQMDHEMSSSTLSPKEKNSIEYLGQDNPLSK
ncbi:uncharacterized protein LOC135924682 [Gordionus sp. m RMFG-2023]|uniref:uncharacterized protein LOC135924682 n=1 Tax=Gordionus sp. m RMFG-2023 TaxID=3053472 RepID=UPI0031FD8F97